MPTRNKVFYDGSVKIFSFEGDKLVKGVFDIVLIFTSHAESCRDAWKSWSRWAINPASIADEADCRSLIRSTSAGPVIRQSIMMEKNWLISIDQRWLLLTKFLMHIVNFWTEILCYDHFAHIQEGVMDRTSHFVNNKGSFLRLRRRAEDTSK